MNFNKQQKQAIEHYEGACAVIAGAGSGKSTVLLNRIKNLIEEHSVNQKEILAISFTRNTADELKSKLNKMGYLNVNVGTFHSICGRILIQEDMNISDKLIKDWQIENCLKGIDKKVDVNDVISFISYQKNYLKAHTDEFVAKDSNYDENSLRRFYKAYEQYKQQNNLYDFDDYMIECYKVLKDNPNKYTYDFVLVDEHQDSNLVQNLLIKELCPSENVFCVFDYRQAIYSFRGGNTEYCMNFDKWWNNPTVINLDINYRSNKNIVDNANGFIKRYYGDYEHYSDSVANSENNGDITINTYYNKETEGEEVVNKIDKLLMKGENPSEIVVLYRLNSNSGNTENELRQRGIKYDIQNDSSFFKRKEIAGILSYLRLIENPHDDSAFENVFRFRNYPTKFFSNKILEDIREYSGKHNLSMYESFISMSYPKSWQKDNALLFEDILNKLRLQKDKGVFLSNLIDNVIKSFRLHQYVQDTYTSREEIKDRLESFDTFKSFVKGNKLDKFIAYAYSTDSSKKKKNDKDAIKLMTIHQSKGLEFKHVFLVGIEDGKFPNDKSDILDEARLFYVGVTRSKEHLYLSQIYDGNKFTEEYKGNVL